MRLIIPFIIMITLLSFFSRKGKPTSSIHQFKVATLNGDTLDFATLKGKKILIVNTASKCGLTPQFEGLESIYKTYSAKNFVVIGFPCNQFKEQDPGTNSEIKEFCTRNYGVTFPMMEKIDVKDEHIAPIYEWLTSKEKNGVMSSSVVWNFQKYMIDENGYLVDYVLPIKQPNCKKIIHWIEKK